MENSSGGNGGFSQYETYKIMDAVLRPFKDKDWFQKLIWGAIPFFGSFMMLGYSLIYGRGIVERKDINLPKWDGNWGSIAVRSLLGICIYLLYGLIPFIVAVICAIPAITAMGAAGSKAFPFSFGLMIIPAIVWIILGLIFFIPLPIAVLRYVLTDSFGEAFKISNILKIIFINPGQYILVLLVLFAVSIVAAMANAVVNMVLGLLPCIGALISIAASGFVGGAIGVVNMSLIGEFYYHFVEKAGQGISSGAGTDIPSMIK